MENAPLGFVSILCGIIFVIAALFMLVFPPRKINDFYGYRTSNSKKSQQRWDFSQRYSAWRMIEVGAVMILVSIGIEYTDVSETAGVCIGLALLAGSALYLLWRTESAIKKKFPN